MSKSTLRFFSLVFILMGVLTTLLISLPIIKYEITARSRFQVKKERFLSPLTGTGSLAYTPQDLGRASNWFVGAPDLPEVTSKVRYYTISIPRLKINNATVEIGGEDLSKSLIHFKGTALPGRVGNSVIFGHSTLPQLFNSKSYLTTFTFLPTLKKDDQILVSYDGVTYKFKIEQMFEVKPEDIQILNQNQDGSYLTLVTCVPPGTYLRRLVVRSRLVPIARKEGV